MVRRGLFCLPCFAGSVLKLHKTHTALNETFHLPSFLSLISLSALISIVSDVLVECCLPLAYMRTRTDLRSSYYETNMSAQAGPSNLRRTDSGTLVELVSEISSVGGDMSDQVQGDVGDEYKDELESDSGGDDEDEEGAAGIDVSDDEWDTDDSSGDDEVDGEDDDEEEDGEDDDEGDENAETDDEMGIVEAGEQLTLEDGESSIPVLTRTTIS